MPTGLAPFAAPTARTAAGVPMRRASVWYETVSPGAPPAARPAQDSPRASPAPGAPRPPRPPPAPRRGGPPAVAERAPEPQVGRREGVGLAEGAHRDVVRRPRADAEHGGEARDRVLEPARGVEHELSARHGAGKPADGRGPATREADRGEVRVGERLGPREEMREAVLRPVVRSTEGAYETPGERGRAAYRHLLAEHGAHRQLEGVPRPGHAQPGAAGDERRQLGAPREVVRDPYRVGVEVEEAPRALHDLAQALGARAPDAHHELQLARGRAHRDRARRISERDRPPVGAARDRLDAGRGARREEGEQPRPVERRPESEPRGDAHGHALSVHRAFDPVWQAADLVVACTRKSGRGSRPPITSARAGRKRAARPFTAPRTASLTRISPPSARSAMRAATFTSWPMRSPARERAAPAWMPMRS